MICLAPNVTGVAVNETGSRVLLGFMLDNVANVRSYRNFTVFPDPRFGFPEEEEGYVIKENELILTVCTRYTRVVNLFL